MKKIWIGLSLFLTVVALAELAWFHLDSHPRPAHSQFVSMKKTWVKERHPVSLPKFQLVGNKNRHFLRKDLRGQWDLLLFGYTSCPDACPASLSMLSRTVKYMHDNGLEPVPRVIFISVDPDRDSPAHLADYLTNFDKDFIGLTGKPSELKKLMHALGSDYQIDKARGSITVDHATSLFLINPEGRLTGLFSHATPPSSLGPEIKVALHSDYAAKTYAP